MLIPNVAIDFSIDVKFLKLPIKAIPGVPKKIDTIFMEKIPKTKLIPTEMELTDKTFTSIFCLKNFKIKDFELHVLDFLQQKH